MQPLELRTTSFRFRNESQFQPWCEDDRVHRAAPLLAYYTVHFVTIEVTGTVECVFLIPLGLMRSSFCAKKTPSSPTADHISDRHLVHFLLVLGGAASSHSFLSSPSTTLTPSGHAEYHYSAVDGSYYVKQLCVATPYCQAFIIG